MAAKTARVLVTAISRFIYRSIELIDYAYRARPRTVDRRYDFLLNKFRSLKARDIISQSVTKNS